MWKHRQICCTRQHATCKQFGPLTAVQGPRSSQCRSYFGRNVLCVSAWWNIPFSFVCLFCTSIIKQGLKIKKVHLTAMHSFFLNPEHWHSSSSYFISPGSSRLMEGLITSPQIISVPVNMLNTGCFCSVQKNLCIIIQLLLKTFYCCFCVSLRVGRKISGFLLIFFSIATVQK